MAMNMRRIYLTMSWQWLHVLLFATTTTIRSIRAQSMAGAGGTPWIIPFGIVVQNGDQISPSSLNEQQEHFASALVYDSELDRIYVTGVSHTRKRTSSSNTPTISPIDDDDDDDDGSAQYQDDDAYDYNNNDDDANGDPASINGTERITKSDCFLGILQVPRRGSGDATMTSVVTNANDWIRQHTYIGTRESQEACSGIDIIRRGNDHKVYLIGHSLFGPSVLENQLNWYNSTHQIHENNNNNHTSSNISSSVTNNTNTTTIGANQTTTSIVAPVVYGFVMDVTWYNGHVPTGYLMHHVTVEYPIGITASSMASNEDIYIASIQSLSGIVNPAHTIYETMKRQMDGTSNSINNTATTTSDTTTTYPMLHDTTTSGAYVPPEYGESYSFHLRRIGERSQSLMDILTLPDSMNGISNATLYASKIEGSKLLNLLKLSKQMKTTESTDNVNSTTKTMPINATNTTITSGANATTTNNLPTDVTETQPLSYGEYRFVVEPLVERWGRTFSANIQEETSATTTTLHPSLYSIQVSSLLRCTIKTLVESNVLSSKSGENDDDNTNDDNDDNSDDDSITYVQRQQDMIFVAGSTRGSGLVLGGEIGDTSLHGFISSFDATTGVLLRRKPIVTISTVTTTTSSSNTVTRNPGYTVRVFGMCQQDPYTQQPEISIYHSSHYIYVVGMTDGIIDHQSYATQQHQPDLRVGVYHAFIQKIDATTLSVQWTKQLGAAKFLNGTNTTQYGSIHGISCAVTPDGYQVYLGGTVLGGASTTIDGGLTTTTKSHGRDDIFVAQFMTSDGKMNYVKQIGTPHDDTLANGVSLVADKYGNAIALGNTRGSVLGIESSANLTNKVILISIDRMTGNHVDISGETTKAPENMVEQITSQRPTPGPPVALDEKESSSSWSDLSRINIVYICVLGGLVTAVLVSVCVSVYTCRQRSRTDKMIARYLLSLTAEDCVNKSGRRSDDKDNLLRSKDLERTKLFPNEDYDQEHATEPSYDDDYETVSFVPSSRQSAGQTTLNSEPMSHYEDTLLRLNHPKQGEKLKGRARSLQNQTRIKLDEPEPVDDDPLRRWLVRDP